MTSIVVQAEDGGRFRALLELPADRAEVPDRAETAGAPADVLILPDGRGLDEEYGRLARRFAAAGSRAMVIDLYGRTAGTGAREGNFLSRNHSAALRWATVRLDVDAAVNRLRDLPDRHPVVAVGFCLGGRVALLAATRRRRSLAGVVAFYPQTRGPARSDLPAPDTLVEMLRCPVLSLFGGADDLIGTDEIRAWRAELAVAPVPGEVVVYPGMPHSFFDRRAAEFPVETADAWNRVTRFLRSVAVSAPAAAAGSPSRTASGNAPGQDPGRGTPGG